MNMFHISMLSVVIPLLLWLVLFHVYIQHPSRNRNMTFSDHFATYEKRFITSGFISLLLSLGYFVFLYFYIVPEFDLGLIGYLLTFVATLSFIGFGTVRRKQPYVVLHDAFTSLTYITLLILSFLAITATSSQKTLLYLLLLISSCLSVITAAKIIRRISKDVIVFQSLTFICLQVTFVILAFTS